MTISRIQPGTKSGSCRDLKHRESTEAAGQASVSDTGRRCGSKRETSRHLFSLDFAKAMEFIQER
jgi:hypothetical protein